MFRASTNRFFTMAAITLATSLFAPCDAQAQCAVDALIDGIEVGYVYDAPSGGPDNGSAVVVRLNTGQRIALNPYFNGNEQQGISLIAAVRMAFSLRLPVTLLDHFGGNCDDFDQINFRWPN